MYRLLLTLHFPSQTDASATIEQVEKVTLWTASPISVLKQSIVGLQSARASEYQLRTRTSHSETEIRF